MPFIRISVAKGTTAAVKQAVSNAIHTALVTAFNVPEADKFQLLTEVSPEDLVCTPEYLGIRYSPKITFIQIVANEGRTVEMKKNLYRSIASAIAETTDIPAADVFINLVEVKKENWSFGNGLAQYAPAE